MTFITDSIPHILTGKNLTQEKFLRYLEIEHIDDPCQIVIAVNSKEYYEHFESFSSNKKYKGQEKGAAGMNFENYANRAATVNQIENFDIPQN